MTPTMTFLRRSIVIATVLLVAGAATSAAPAHAGPRPDRASRTALGLYRTTVTLRHARDAARLDKLGAVPLTAMPETRPTTAVVLVDGAALDDLARLRFEPQVTDELGDLIEADGSGHVGLASTVRLLLSESARVEGSAKPKTALADAEIPYTGLLGLRQSLKSMRADERADLAALEADDDDSDGLSNTQEEFWCTNPLTSDSDRDGASDWEEVRDAKDWLGNRRGGPPSTGKPFSGWPATIAGCVDDDKDSVPDLAERWELGLSLSRESTDRDKFDDGQELFGLTYCPSSAGYCGYGALPRNEDFGVVFSEMPAWVESPGSHPFAAAFPVPEVDIVQSSIRVQTITTVTTDHQISSGTERSYSTAKTEGTSTSVADTTSWNEWDEVSLTTEAPQFSLKHSTLREMSPDFDLNDAKRIATSTASAVGGALEKCAGSVNGKGDTVCSRASGLVDRDVVDGGKRILTAATGAVIHTVAAIPDIVQDATDPRKCKGADSAINRATCAVKAYGTRLHEELYTRLGKQAEEAQEANGKSTGSRYGTSVNGTGMNYQPVYELGYPAEPFVPTQTTTHGSFSWRRAYYRAYTI